MINLNRFFHKAEKEDRRSKDDKIEDVTKYAWISLFPAVILLSSFFFNTPAEILQGLTRLVVSPSILITDYMVVGNIGASFFNAGLLSLIAIYIAYKSKVHMNGPIIAATFIILGFSFFGKNIYNVLPIVLGVYLRSKYQNMIFGKVLLSALFGTGLGPVVSQISFGFDLPLSISLPLGISFGLLSGFILPPLANHFITFHNGFNLYNIGFTTGMIAMVIMAVFRSFGFDTSYTLIEHSGSNSLFTLYFFLFFLLMFFVGMYLNRHKKSSYFKLLKHSGRLVTDFVVLSGFGITLVNMSLLGLSSLAYIIIVGGQMNGPTLGAVLTVVGFGAFGKHLYNVWPIFVGVFLSTFLKIWDMSSTSAVLAGLFGTTLAPISGTYGPLYGIIAGFIHISMVMNVGVLHGGMNLYNNGFSGGFVAAFLTPIIDSVHKNRRKEQ